MSMIQLSEELKEYFFPTGTILCKSRYDSVHYFHTLLIPSEGFT